MHVTFDEEIRLARKASLRKIVQAYQAIHGKKELVRLFNLKGSIDDVTQSMVTKIDEKIRVEGPDAKRKARSFTNVELLAANLLIFLESEGYDTSAIKVDDKGKMIRKPSKRKPG